jgi:hypothetical protein
MMRAPTRQRYLRRAALLPILLLLGTSASHGAQDGTEPPKQLISIGPGPFALNAVCLAPQEGPRPTPLPFPRSVLEDEMRRQLLRLSVPLLARGAASDSAKTLNFGSCVWQQEDGGFWYRLSLTGPWPTALLGDVEDVSYWPMEMGTVGPNQLRTTLVRKTHELARTFVRSVRINASSK